MKTVIPKTVIPKMMKTVIPKMLKKTDDKRKRVMRRLKHKSGNENENYSVKNESEKKSENRKERYGYLLV